MGRRENIEAERLEQALAGRLPEPEGAAGLDPLTHLAAEVRQTLAPPAVSAASRAAAKVRLLNRLSRAVPPAARRPGRPHVGLLQAWRPALAALLLTAGLLGTGLGVAHAAGDALPGDVLYYAKRGLEQVRLALATAPGSRASLRAHFAAERLQEAEALLAAGRGAEANGLLSEYRAEISAIVDLARQSSDREGVEGLQQALSAQQQALSRVLERSGEAGEAAVGAAIEDARHGQAVLQTLLEGGNPSDLAPGQQEHGTDSPDGSDDHGRGQGQGQAGGRGHGTPTPQAP